ncbi:MAG: tyrosine-type recombinase/integrase [Gemmatimonadaceae bacterium]
MGFGLPYRQDRLPEAKRRLVMPYRKKDKETGKHCGAYYISVPNGHGGRVQRCATTTNKEDARNYEAMLRELGLRGTREFDVINLVVEDAITVSELHLHYKANILDDLRERFGLARRDGRPAKVAEIEVADLEVADLEVADLDIEPLVKKWERASAGHLKPTTRSCYVAAVRLLIPEDIPFLRSALTGPRLSHWMADMSGSAATKHYRWSAIRHFIVYLLEIKKITADPASGIRRPKLPDPRDNHLTAEGAERLTDAMPSPHRELTVLLNGTGAEVSPALKLRVRDVNSKNRTVFVAGAKNPYRKRWVRVAEWAWPTVERLIAGKGANEYLFNRNVIDRYNHWRAHISAVKTLVAAGFDEYEGYTPRDARHTFAVRLVKAGASLQIVARQLGHKDITMVAKVYGRYQPTSQEFDRWEREATKCDGYEREDRQAVRSDA